MIGFQDGVQNIKAWPGPQNTDQDSMSPDTDTTQGSLVGLFLL